MTRRSLALGLVSAAVLLRCSSFSASSPDGALDAGVLPDDAMAIDPIVDAGTSDVAVVLPDGCDPTCTALHGACGVRVGPSCIDATEVTIADWRLFGMAKTTVDAGTECGSVKPDVLGVRPEEQLPITDVTFCEARAYCAWAGKELCGRVGGGALTPDEPTKQVSVWYNACTNGSDDPKSFIGDAGCNLTSGKPAASRSTCQGGRPGLFDMIGNVAEWIDALEPNAGSFQAYFVGSSYVGGEFDTCQTERTKPIYEHAVDLGFRCCTTPP